ncbi:mannose-1-phosphate guanyltransferase [Gordonibacter sp. 28C]|uniref:sugar phosphate nucleotidyltransferase n=1 Tax=Gordonibacter sp. 28C TaxID=2078569 RepID=UPI000DF75660|nr:sugar phosphate nucleotidyltransferase [Gordonibacter sp. 28C]RDB58977.1 mannose-1-phosphate guanyltransferase [Gordonibacter sp. 28C]
MINIVLLSGGSGTRLWPLSNEARSKQFLKVLRDAGGCRQSMVQRTFDMIRNVGSELNIVVATCASQLASIQSQVKGDYKVVVEPERRDTAPAIMLSAAYLSLCAGSNADDTVVVMPIDTFADQSYYDCVVNVDAAVQADAADLVLLGACPTYPSEKFGYILPKRSDTPTRMVSRFIEKPKEAVAKELIDEGALWNCGVFGFRLSYLMEVLKRYHPLDSFDDLVKDYSLLPKNSFDYEVVEKAQSVAVIPYEGTWKDLGTWNTLTEEMADFEAGRVISDEFCSNTHVINETGLPMVVAGLKDAVVVATPDGIIVSDKVRSAHVKPLIEQVAATRPMYESRQWGEYSVLGQGVHAEDSGSLEKMLVINAGKQLSYQSHACRSEVWTVVDGEGEVVLDGETEFVSRGSVIKIPSGKKHAIRAITRLSIVEVQIGSDLVEEDIERFGFFWNLEE